MKMVMGGETEYAISGRSDSGQVVDQVRLLQRLFEHITGRLGYSSQSSRGRFLSNGGLLYLDAGLHLEWATPECTNPYDVVRYLKAGDAIVHDLATSYKEASHSVDIFCSRASVDYVSGTLWAAHESYMHDVPPAELQAQLTPFLASRVILGAGGWNHTAPGLQFTMSPRAHFITKLADRDSQYIRPLFHTKNETLSHTGSHRLHVACSESLCSETANVLRFGTTALVLALLERGFRPGRAVTLVSPIRAMQHFAIDPAWRACVIDQPRRWMSATDIQRYYLECVEAQFDTLELPDWAASVCRTWRMVLDALDADPTRLQTTLDWGIKQGLFERQLARRGIAWSSLRWWNAALHRLKRVWEGRRLTEPLTLQNVIENHPHVAAEKARLTRRLEGHGLKWVQLEDLAHARSEAFELDAKFGALGEGGIFNAMDAAGALQHRVGAMDVDRAVTEPPPDTRARVRGSVVRRLSDAKTPYSADWTAIYEIETRRTLNLCDPFESEERWTARPT